MKNEKAIKQIEKGIIDLQEKLNELKNEKPKFKNGWYKNNNGYLVFYNFDTDTYYGLDYNYDRWIEGIESSSFFSEDFDTPATEQEVVAALVAEAKKRGLKDGSNVVDLQGLRNELVNSYIIRFNIKSGLLFMGETCIFLRGKWATIIEEPRVFINSHLVENDCCTIKIGSEKFNKIVFRKTILQLKNYNIESFTMRGEVFSVNELFDLI